MQFRKIAVEIKSSGKTCKDDRRDQHGGKDIKQAAARANDLGATGHVRLSLCGVLSDGANSTTVFLQENRQSWRMDTSSFHYGKNSRGKRPGAPPRCIFP